MAIWAMRQMAPHKLWISYRGRKYRLFGTYKTTAEALAEYDRMTKLHMVRGDRIKLTYKEQCS